MSNVGQANSLDSATPTLESTQPLTWGCLILILIALIGTVIVGIPIISALYGLLLPPTPPLPPANVLLDHTNLAHGADEWRYQVDATPCAVFRFYTDYEACPDLSICQGDEALPAVLPTNRYVATCHKDETFATFALRWQVVITAPEVGQRGTYLTVSRTVFWSGHIPATDTFGQFP